MTRKLKQSCLQRSLIKIPLVVEVLKMNLKWCKKQTNWILNNNQPYRLDKDVRLWNGTLSPAGLPAVWAMMAFTSVDLKDLTNSLEHSPESFYHCDLNKNLLAIFQFVIFATTWMEIQPQHKVTGWKSNHLVGNPTNNKNLENLKF